MATVIFCDVCGHPIVRGECMHMAMGLTAKEWKERVEKRKQQEKDER